MVPTLPKWECCSFNYLPVIRKNNVRMTRRVNPPTAAVAMTRICPCSAAISEAEREAQRNEVNAPSPRGFEGWVKIFQCSNVANGMEFFPWCLARSSDGSVSLCEVIHVPGRMKGRRCLQVFKMRSWHYQKVVVYLSLNMTGFWTQNCIFVFSFIYLNPATNSELFSILLAHEVISSAAYVRDTKPASGGSKAEKEKCGASHTLQHVWCLFLLT